MKKFLTLILFLTPWFASIAQFQHPRVYSTFESLKLSGTDTFNNGADGKGGFIHHGRFFNNVYDANWGSWSGWSLSNSTNDSTSGYMNQYSSITGGGLSNTPHYMVGTTGASIVLDEATPISGAYFTNSTYAYMDMKDGSSFSKKFGGASGTEADSFVLIIRSFLNGNPVDTVEFYLADYRFVSSTEDYIVDDWTYVDFNDDPASDITIDSISFDFMSSDNGQWGMNTPAFFCMDDFNAVSGLRYLQPEAFDLGYFAEDTFYNGSDLSGGFLYGYAFFQNSYDTVWNSWSGWSVSSMLDTLTPGFQNQYSCIDVTKRNFMVSSGNHLEIRAPYQGSENERNPLYLIPPPPYHLSLSITNSTYAYLDMKEGSQFSKKFGGVDGNDPDYFRVLVTYFDTQDSILLRDTVYLADFRPANNEEDYILDHWTAVRSPEEEVNGAHRIVFDLESTDNGQWGMNTPAAFCLSFEYNVPNAVNEYRVPSTLLYPNPGQRMVSVRNAKEIKSVSIYNLSGEKVLSSVFDIPSNEIKLDIRSLPAGLYLIETHTDYGRTVNRWIKE